MVFFFFYLFSILVLGSYNVGPYSIRVYMTVIMLIVLLCKRISMGKAGVVFPMPKKVVYSYAIFVIITALTLFLNGEYGAYDFTKMFLSYYLNCFITFFAFEYYINDQKQLKAVIYFLLALIIVDGVVTVLQHIGNPIGKAIAMVITTVSDEVSDISSDGNYDINQLFGASLPIGIFGRVFTNANCLATIGIMSMAYMFTKVKRIEKLGLIGCLFFCFFSCFVTQERTAFAVFLLTAAYLFFKEKNNKKILFFAVLAILIFVVYYLPDLLLSDKLGRISNTNFKEDDRMVIWAMAVEFLKQNLLLGGPVSYSKMTDIAPHNFFLLAFINSGLVGGIVAIYIYIYMIWISLNFFLSKRMGTVRTLAGSVLIYSAICLFHNASIVTGDTLIFILFPIFLKASLILKADSRVIVKRF